MSLNGLLMGLTQGAKEGSNIAIAKMNADQQGQYYQAIASHWAAQDAATAASKPPQTDPNAPVDGAASMDPSYYAAPAIPDQPKNAAPAIPTGPAVTADPSPFVGAIRAAENSGANAVSPKGATGVMQVMPGTATNPGYGVTPAQNNTPQEIQRVGNDYAGAMLQRYAGNPTLAAIAYNAGPGVADQVASGKMTMDQLPAETKAYIPKVLSALQQAQPQTIRPVPVAPAQTATTAPAVTPPGNAEDDDEDTATPAVGG